MKKRLWYNLDMQRGGDQMIQETIKAVKEAEAKAQQKIKDASVRAQSIISEAEKEAENIIRKAETAAGEQAASDMKAAEERAHSTENTVVGQVEEELAALKKKAESKHEQAIQAVMDSLF